MLKFNPVRKLFVALGKAIRPPKLLSNSQWAMENFRLSAVASAATGRFRPWKFQRGIMDAMGDPLLERVSVIKSTRTGYTKSVIASIGAIAVNDPSPMILLMPTDDDARGIMVDEIDPAFKESPALQGIMRQGRQDGRNTLTQRSFFGGGSLKAIAAAAPRNLRRHTAKYLFCDEVDGMKITKEGDPLKIAEKRTDSFPDRKIVMGSTPVDELTSIIIKRYEESDMRIFEMPCPHCDHRFELLWENMQWTPGDPDSVVAICPGNGCVIEEKHKPAMIEAGEWRATKPEVKRHAGFRLNALISLFHNSRWPALVQEYETAEKNGPADMQVFVNTVLGKVWSAAIESVTEAQLMARAEDFGLIPNEGVVGWKANIPEDVYYITAGVDVQPNRIEITLLGHSQTQRYILGHIVVRGSAKLDTTWAEVLEVLQTKWRHPLGGMIGIEAAAVDSGDGNMTQTVYDFVEPLQGRKIFAIKGAAGPRKIIEASKSIRRNRTAPLYIVGVDEVKTDVVMSLPLGKEDLMAFRFSKYLSLDFYMQLNSEKRVLKYKNGKPEITFERIGRRKAEALDTVVYAIAVFRLIQVDWDKRLIELKGDTPTKPSLKDLVAKLHSR